MQKNEHVFACAHKFLSSAVSFRVRQIIINGNIHTKGEKESDSQWLQKRMKNNNIQQQEENIWNPECPCYIIPGWNAAECHFITKLMLLMIHSRRCFCGSCSLFGLVRHRWKIQSSTKQRDWRKRRRPNERMRPGYFCQYFIN